MYILGHESSISVEDKCGGGATGRGREGTRLVNQKHMTEITLPRLYTCMILRCCMYTHSVMVESIGPEMSH